MPIQPGPGFKGLRLHNTLTREKDAFNPIHWNMPGIPESEKQVRMYVCGPTVYDFAHIGNARPLIVFDVLFRLLRHLYGPEHVTYVRNITDVDDKINARAAEEYPDLALNDAIRAVTEKTAAQFHADVDALGCLRPTHEPRATEYVEREGAPTDMLRLIAELVSSGHAYVEQGHVLFEVKKMPDYGRLSNRSLDDMIAGARVEVAPYKRDPMDFVLWKPSKAGEPSWPSPWSNGRPGWHIECSAMAGALLGETFDIHGGGIDLIFPHHENEIAQSRCAFDTPTMANYWLHNGFLQVEGEKMSKSLGNFVTIRDLLNVWAGDVLRLNMLKTHYRQPIDWTENSVTLATMELEEWANTLQGYYSMPGGVVSADLVAELSDDLNSSSALGALRELHTKARRGSLDDYRNFAASCKLLGFQKLNYPGFFQFGISGLDVDKKTLFGSEHEITRYRAATANNAPEIANAIAEIVRRKGLEITTDPGSYFTLTPRKGDLKQRVDDLIAARAAARKAKDFAEADRIRMELDAMGIALKDSKDPKTGELVTTWEVKR